MSITVDAPLPTRKDAKDVSAFTLDTTLDAPDRPPDPEVSQVEPKRRS
jgi:hypothetical protein